MRKLFAGFLVSVILLGGDLIYRAWAQTPNTFCASNLACTVTGLWNHTGGLQNNGVNVADVSSAQSISGKTFTTNTFDISLNTLKTATNTAAHVPRNNGTQYVDAQLSAADLSNGVTGNGVVVLASNGTLASPILQTVTITGASGGSGVQGTDTKLLTAGAVSGGAGATLCTTANGGATTTGCASGGAATVYNSTATASAASIGVTTMVASVAANQNYFFTIWLEQTGATSGCSSQPSVLLIVNYTDPSLSNAVSDTMTAIPNGSTTWTTAPLFAASTGTIWQASVAFRAKAGTAVTYQVSYLAGSGCGTGATYIVAPNLIQQ